MSAEPLALVGSPAARSVHGLSAGADLALLGRQDPARLRDVLVATLAHEAATVVAGTAAQVLVQLADLAESDPRETLVVAAADLLLPLPAVLDLLDKPGVRTGVLTVAPTTLATGRDDVVRARVGGDGVLVESVGTAVHQVTRPNRALPGLLRVDGRDRAVAAAAWRAASAQASGWDVDGFAVAVLALVRAGVPVQSVAMGPFTWSRGPASSPGAAGSEWQQRLRGSSRGNDGFFSTYAVRPLSRRLTGVGLRLGWSPNAVTVASMALGVLAAVLVLVDQRWSWVAAALIIQLALVVDCVDGEIARFTRRFSALGAWLDAVGDRVKEYAVFAACAFVGVRHGGDLWVLATVAMALVTLRHLENDTYDDRLAPVLASRPDGIPVGEPHDLGPEDARTDFAPDPDARWWRVYWAKKVMHMPIAERYLLISLGLLTFSPQVVLWAIVVGVGAAMVWTIGGRSAKALTGRDRVPPATGDAWSHVDHETDLGPLARQGYRLPRLPVPVGPGCGLLLVAVTVVATRTDQLWLVPAATVLVAPLLGTSLRPPVRHVLAWNVPWLLWVAEVVVLTLVVQHVLPARGLGVLFALLAVVAYHRYDTVYRIRDTGEPPARWLSTLGLGADGRILLVAAVACWWPSTLVPVLWALTAYLAVLYLGESTLGWRRWIRGTGPATDEMKGAEA